MRLGTFLARSSFAWVAMAAVGAVGWREPLLARWIDPRVLGHPWMALLWIVPLAILPFTLTAHRFGRIRLPLWLVLAAVSVAVLFVSLLAVAGGPWGEASFLFALAFAGPFLVIGATSLRGSRSLGGTRAIAICAVAMIAVGAGVAAGGPWTSCVAPQPGQAPGWLASAIVRDQIASFGMALLAALLLFLGAIRERGGARTLLGLMSVGALAIAGRDASLTVAARIVEAAENGGRVDVASLERLAEACNALEVIAGAAIGALAAWTVARSLGRAGHRTRLVVQMIAATVPLLFWVLDAGALPPPSARSSPEWAEPLWRSVTPIEFDGGHPVAAPDRQCTTWVVGADGEIARSYGSRTECLQVVADADVRLDALSDRVFSSAAGDLQLVGRSAAMVALDAASQARARFPLVEAASHEARAIDQAGWAGSQDSFPGSRAFAWDVIGRDGPDARLRDVTRLRMATLRPSHPGSTPARAWPRGELAALVALLTMLGALMVAARARWSRRIDPRTALVDRKGAHGAISPAWLDPRACDAEAVVHAGEGYRITDRPLVRTAQRFLPALLRTAWLAADGARPWIAIILAGLALLVASLR